MEPLSNYSVLRARKEFNQGRQGVGVLATSMLRDLRTDNLKDILNRNALALAMDGWSFLDKNKTWVLTGWLGTTRVEGSKEDILSLQESAPHYFQRPDASHLNYDPQATSLSGWAGKFTLNKEKGNLVVNAALAAVSPGFDSNDVGFMAMGDNVYGHAAGRLPAIPAGKNFPQLVGFNGQIPEL